MNFDLIAIEEVKSIIKNEKKDNTLDSVLEKFGIMNDTISENIKLLTEQLSKKLDIFINMQQKNENVSYSNILDTMQAGIKSINDLSLEYKLITDNIKSALFGINNLIASPKINTEAINKNTVLLEEIKEKFSEFKEKSIESELEHLKQVSFKLENNIDNTFVSIETSLNTVSQNLKESYNQFFDMCKKFNETYSASIDSKQISDALAILIYENKKLTDLQLNNTNHSGKL